MKRGLSWIGGTASLLAAAVAGCTLEAMSPDPVWDRGLAYEEASLGAGAGVPPVGPELPLIGEPARDAANAAVAAAPTPEPTPAPATTPADEAAFAPASPGPWSAPVDNPFKAAQGDDLRSTFAVDVDTASYALVRRYLRHHQLPPAGAVRIEELINNFDVDDPAPPAAADPTPFASRVEVAGCPWRPGHRLVRVALRGREVDAQQRPASNLVFLIDVSGSMSWGGKLPLLKHGLRRLVEQLDERDRVSIVVYAGAAGLVLPPTSGDDRSTILAAINTLEAGGSTNGGAGIQLAYRAAIEGFVEGGANRVLLCTDGDFNVGASSPEALERLIEEKRQTGVFLTCLGFGVSTGDVRMETLADKGNGHYALIDDERDAQRFLVDELSGTLVTIAKDVKVQVEWSPERVRRWRLIGYENRVLANRDFADDARDGGEIGAGHRVTALYEVEPVEGAADADAPLLTLRLRWKEPDGERSAEAAVPGLDRGTPFADASPDLKFAASVAAGGMLLRRSPHAGDATWARAIRWAADGLGRDARGDRAEWLDLLRRAARIQGAPVDEETSGRAGQAGQRG